MSEFLILSLLIICAFTVAAFVDRIGVPRVSVYIVFGVLFSPDLIGQLIDFPFKNLSPVVTDISLGIIAFLIGLEIDRSFLKTKKRALLLSSLGESLLAVVSVTCLVFLYGYLVSSPLISLKVALAIGAIAATTAPASTIAVVEEYGAKGPIVALLLGIVIVDDAIGVLVFEFMTGLDGQSSNLSAIAREAFRIAGSIGLGGTLGAGAGLFSRRFKQEELRFPIFISVVVLCTSAAILLDFSHILSCMALGLATQYFSDQERKNLILPIKHIEEFVFIVFFIFAGLHFDPSLFVDHYALIIVYVLARAAGKYFGAYLGARMGGVDVKTAKWIGLGLIPQAGVAIGLALSLSHISGFQKEATIVINIVLGSTIVYEVVGPILARYAIKKSGSASAGLAREGAEK